MTTETQATHTPGPWSYQEAVEAPFGSLDKWYVFADDAPEGAKLPAVVDTEANARLIAAAPSMLSILETVYARTTNEWLQHEAASGIRLALGDEAYEAWYKTHAR